MAFRLVQRRTVWLPTLAGWFLLLVLGCVPAVIWFFWGEGILAVTDREPADVLVVEGWIGAEGIRAAYNEFVVGGYKLVVATGGLSGERWSVRRWNYANEAADGLARLGVPEDKLIVAPSRDTDVQRTFEMAIAARNGLDSATGRTINIFTRGAHARRSRLIFAKVFGSDFRVGVVSWKPPLFSQEPWWRSSERAEDLIKETVGYVFELMANSGRFSNTSRQISALVRTAPAGTHAKCDGIRPTLYAPKAEG
jgi:hypothetical protein